jgi:hypothetical protein
METIRIALLSTPRSGNTWLRHLLAASFDLDQITVHRPDQLDWDNLPPRCVVQLHWHRTGDLEALLDRHSFRVAVIRRHPLDVLLSLLHWASSCPLPPTVWEDEPALAGDRGTESPIRGLSPRDPGFLAYACSTRAEALLSVSLQWWDAPGAVRVGYEDLVADPTGQLRRFAEDLGEPLRRPAAEVGAAHDLEGLKALHPDTPQHFWQGRPGLWRSLLPSVEARRIATAQRPSFERFGYACDPDEALDGRQADLNWRALRGAPSPLLPTGLAAWISWRRLLLRPGPGRVSGHRNTEVSMADGR